MDPDTHTIQLAQVFRDAADKYLKENEGADINDVLTALSMMLVMHCIFYDISRTETLRNVSTTYETMYATKDAAMRVFN